MPKISDSFEKCQKYITIRIQKKVKDCADKLGTDVIQKVAPKLEETIKSNIIQSYEPRNSDMYYIHTKNLITSIYVTTEKNRVKAYVKDIVYYDEGKNRISTIEVYNYLRFGTRGSIRHKILPNGVVYDYFFVDPETSKILPAINYPTPVHEFEAHTHMEMIGFVEGLENDIMRRYKKRR